MTLLAASGFCRANLLEDGGFEAPGGIYYEDIVGGGTIGNWSVLGSDIEYVNTTYGESWHGVNDFEAQEGNYSVDLTGDYNTGNANGVQQTVSTVSGMTYTLSFWVGVAQSNDGSTYYAAPATVDLSLNGGARVGYTNANIGTSGSLNWEEFQTTFQATGSQTTVTFFNNTPTPTAWAGLDNVDLEAAPEPTTLLLFGAGSIALLVARRRA